MFAVHEVTVDARYEVVTARLIHLINWGALHGVCEAVYEGGLETVLRVGPFGGQRGLSKLVRVRVLDPVRRGGTMAVSLRWEATGVAGELFPVLDADLMLLADGDDRSRLELVGSYRPPFGRAGVAVDAVIMGRVAAATIRSLLESLAVVLAQPAPSPHAYENVVPRWRPATEASGS
jgi:hypothetical protein